MWVACDETIELRNPGTRCCDRGGTGYFIEHLDPGPARRPERRKCVRCALALALTLALSTVPPDET